MSATTQTGWRLNPRSFRAKFMLVVGGALLVDLMLAGGISMWNVQRLSSDVTRQVGDGLERSTMEYLESYLETTVERTDLLIDRYHSEVNALAGSMQTLIDNPALDEALGTLMVGADSLTTPLQYNAAGNWWQNLPGAASVVTVWGYLLNADGQPRPEVADDVRTSAAFDIFGPSILAAGPPKLQMYYIGPRESPILRLSPYSDQGAVFDEAYPGHNETNWWDFYFPGLYESWESWLADPAGRPVDSDITTLAPYRDGVTNSTIVSFFQPLYTPDRSAVDGVVGVDLTLDQLAAIVESVHIADTGFGFLTMSDGNVLAVSEAGQQTLGLQVDEDEGFERTLSASSQPMIASLALPDDGDTAVNWITLSENGEDARYLAMLRRLQPINLYASGAGVTAEALTLGFLVPEREIYASLFAAQGEIGDETRRILLIQIATIVLCLLIVLTAVYAVSGRITAGLSALAGAARRLQDKDYSVRVDIPARDEVGAVGVAFNKMAEEIRYHTENLERIVAERTKDLEKANGEIGALNRRLQSENLRLGAELDIARQIQLMVLPKQEELEAIEPIDIACFMSPADEVGGDYYDVLKSGSAIKVGIGDVTGHGLESGVLMLMVQSVARALQERGVSDPAEFLSVLNRAIYKNIERTRTDKHLSLAFLDYREGRVTLSGQHEEVLVSRADGSLETINTMEHGFPIGLEEDIEDFVHPHEIGFDEGDVIVLYTDGITEAENPAGELFGLERLQDSIAAHRGGTAEAIKSGIIADLTAFISSQKIHDDITVVVMRHR